MGLIDGMTTEELTSGISRPRNKEIMRIYKDMELVEQPGSGMNRIMKVYAPDIFKISPNFFHVVLYFDNEHINDRENVPENVTERQKQILAFIEKNNKITANELGEGLSNKSVSNMKMFIDAKDAIVSGVDTENYLIVENNDFAYNTVTTRNADKLSIALNRGEKCLVSPLYTTFKVVDEKLLPEYLCLWFNRAEYDRYSQFNSWGSARELFAFDVLAETEIPIPSIEIQQSIVNIYNAYNERKNINKELKAQIKNICPILIKGSLEEGE